jgi:hypothetical protein
MATVPLPVHATVNPQEAVAMLLRTMEVTKVMAVVMLVAVRGKGMKYM